MFSLGGVLAAQQSLDRPRMNAYMRATTSTAWMMGPAFTFFIADLYGGPTVFYFCTGLSLVWAAFWWWTTPKNQSSNVTSTLKEPQSETMKYSF